MKRPALKGLIIRVGLFSFILIFFISLGHSRTSPVGIEGVQPKQIHIGSFFSGEKITVKAVIPSGNRLALRIIGPREQLNLMKKGRVGGLWMNVEQIHFQGVPKVYLLATSHPLFSLGTEESLKSLELDYPSLLAGTLPGKNRKEAGLLFNELIKLKEEDHLYQILQGSVQLKPLQQGLGDQAEAVLTLPSKIYPGRYSLELIGFKEGKGILLDSTQLEVQLSGFPSLVAGLAARRGLWYGILAVVIAMISGLLIGIVFTSKGGH